MRKPGKVYLDNTNLLYAINGSVKLATSTGEARETMFVNQLKTLHRVNLHHPADFIIDGKVVVEVGGRNKSNRQLKGIEDGYLALGDITVGYQHKIPLYLFLVTVLIRTPQAKNLLLTFSLFWVGFRQKRK